MKTPCRKTSRTQAPSLQDLLQHYACGAVQFSGDANASYERHVVFDHVVAPEAASLRERFEAVAHSLRDLLVPRWLKTGATYDRANPKQVYYLSMEFLIGRSLTNNLTNLLVEPLARDVLQREGLDRVALAEQKPDAGLSNGGLGRLAACFLDSLATRGNDWNTLPEKVAIQLNDTHPALAVAELMRILKESAESPPPPCVRRLRSLCVAPPETEPSRATAMATSMANDPLAARRQNVSQGAPPGILQAAHLLK